MTQNNFGRRCIGCMSQKKGCPGGDPCNSCVKRGVPCIEYIPKTKRKQPEDYGKHEANYTTRAPSAKKRKTESTQGQQPSEPQESPILGISTFKIDVVYKNRWCTLCCVVQYRQDLEHECYTKLNGIFSLLDRAGEILKVTPIGNIESFTIDKVGKRWTDEVLDGRGCKRPLLSQHAQYGPRGPRVGETERVMQMIWREDGTLRDIEGLRRNAGYLSEDTIHYVSLFKLDEAFRSIGLARPALTAYFGALTKANSRFTCEPFVVLSLAAWREDHDRHVAAMKASNKTPKSALEVEDLLFKFYGTVHLEELYRGDRDLEGLAISLAGRSVTRAAIATEVKIIVEEMKDKMRYMLVEAAAACTGTMIQLQALTLLDDNQLEEAFWAIERGSTTYANSDGGQQIVKALLNMRVSNAPRPRSSSGNHEVDQGKAVEDEGQEEHEDS